MSEFVYDVAFSFLQEDIGVAFHLNDLLKGKFKTFLFSEQQKALAFEDGDAAFSKVFKSQSRLVVILYRASWGETRWTNVEMQAIRDRAFISNWEFAKFISLDKSHLPDWLSPRYLWYGLGEYGSTTAAAIIESKLNELGVSSTTESSLERSQRLARKQSWASERKSALNSRGGVKAFNDDYGHLQHLLREKAAGINETLGDLGKIDFSTDKGNIVVYGLGGQIIVVRNQYFQDSLEDSSIRVLFRKRARHSGDHDVTTLAEYVLDYLPSGDYLWSPMRKDSHLDIGEIAEKLLIGYLDRFEKETEKARR